MDARPRDWTILLSWAIGTMSKLLPEDILKDLPNAICNPHLDFGDEEVECLPCFNGLTGDLLFKSPLPGSRRVSRQRLRRVLAQGLRIRWGKTLSGLSSPASAANPVRLTFEDGETYDAHYVLGTDGASSRLRELLLGREAARAQLSGFLFATGIVDYRDADKVEVVVKAHPVAAIMMGMEAVSGCGGRF